jgi:hypothetical protein
MTDRVTVSWNGREYEAVRKGRSESGEQGAVWRVQQDGAVVTSFPAEPADTAADIVEKVRGWLEGNQSRPALDIGRQ